MVWIVTGDGDALAIGGNHFIHAMRRNLDLKIDVQQPHLRAHEGPGLAHLRALQEDEDDAARLARLPVQPAALALGSSRRSSARTIDVEGAHMGGVIKAAAEHKGSVFVEIFQNCPVFNDGAYTFITEKAVKADAQLHGARQAAPLRQGQQEGDPLQREHRGARGGDHR